MPAYIKIREDQLRRTALDLRTRAVEGTVVDGGIFEYLLGNLTHFVISV
jgi:hypothetical protein